jgi:hypothetical protein
MPKPLAVVPDLEGELDALFGLPPAEFTAARNDLVKRLKAAGQADAGAEVGALRKPTVPVWAVNQLARDDPTGVGALLSAGEQLRSAQEAALGGAEEGDLVRHATLAERDALRTLTQRARRLLADADMAAGASVLERVSSTLRAAAIDPAAGELVARGRLDEELDPAGFEALAGMKASPRRRQAASPKPKPKPKEPTVAERRRAERRRKLEDRVAELDGQAREAERAARTAEAAAEAERRKADRAAEAAERARADLAKLD